MCFSAEASFLAAGVTGAIGVVCLKLAYTPRHLALASLPLVFSFQQAIEGTLWLILPSAPNAPTSSALTLTFLLVAQVFWPIFVPIAATLIEPVKLRRNTMLFCLVIGTAIGSFQFYWILSNSHSAIIAGNHIVYLMEYRYTNVLAGAYIVATCLPLISSSSRSVVALGTTVLVGYIISFVFYWDAFVSVWCFFAAAASMVVLGHFEWARRSRLKAAAT